MQIPSTETFPLLAKAPITEAVIQIQHPAGAEWEETGFRQFLQEQLPDYPKMESLGKMQHEFVVKPGGIPQQLTSNLGFTGVRCHSADRKQIAIFQKDSFSFSRLQPYESWELFSAEALRLWQIQNSRAPIDEVQRIGLRFINQIVLPREAFEWSDYLVTAPKTLPELTLPLGHFFHHDIFVVPENPYQVNFIQTIQPATPLQGPALVLDIDVFTTQPMLVKDIEDHLEKMRWLKNKLFFGSITPKTLHLIQ